MTYVFCQWCNHVRQYEATWLKLFIAWNLKSVEKLGEIPSLKSSAALIAAAAAVQGRKGFFVIHFSRLLRGVFLLFSIL